MLEIPWHFQPDTAKFKWSQLSWGFRDPYVPSLIPASVLHAAWHRSRYVIVFRAQRHNPHPVIFCALRHRYVRPTSLLTHCHHSLRATLSFLMLYIIFTCALHHHSLRTSSSFLGHSVISYALRYSLRTTSSFLEHRVIIPCAVGACTSLNNVV